MNYAMNIFYVVGEKLTSTTVNQFSLPLIPESYIDSTHKTISNGRKTPSRNKETN